MKRLVALIVAVVALAVVAAPRRAESRSPRIHDARDAIRIATRTVWDSVYSDSQASRGDSLYKQSCAKCHGANLAGTDSAAELKGKSFLGNWDGLTLDQLYDKILTTMPPDNPKSIPRGQVADVMAYLLSQNRFPAGKAALSDNADQLKTITLLKSQP
jgi:quinoprotein glucose dehydrogenase